MDAEEGGLAKKKNKEKIKTFPCCFEIPLDIAMMGFALVDIVGRSLIGSRVVYIIHENRRCSIVFLAFLYCVRSPMVDRYFI